MEIIDYKLRIDGHWYGLFKDPVTIDGEVIDERDWRIVMITDVPVDMLLKEWHFLVHELSDKEVELYKLKEEHNHKEFKILTTFDFKKEFGKDNEKIRKGYIRTKYDDLLKDIEDLELSIDYLKRRISFLKQLIHTKTIIMEVK